MAPDRHHAAIYPSSLRKGAKGQQPFQRTIPPGTPGPLNEGAKATSKPRSLSGAVDDTGGLSVKE